VPTLLPLLEKLAGEEECVVRNAAVKSLVKLVVSFQKADIATKFVPLIRRMQPFEHHVSHSIAHDRFV
jgi:hypothetical protein